MSSSVVVQTRLLAGLLRDCVKSLEKVEREIKQLEDINNKIHEIDYAIENEQGELIGVREKEDGTAEFVLQDSNSETAQDTVNEIKQGYARLRILDQAKRQGYKNVKEEKMEDGSVRLVVERWR